MSFWRNQLAGPTNPAIDAAWEDPQPRKGFFTDTSICIGCKACEVACKEWNGVPEDGLDLLSQSYDNTGALGASTWRHVAFVEQTSDRIEQARDSGRRLVELGMPTVRTADAALPPATTQSDAAAPGPSDQGIPDVRWLMASDVCKHCTHAACLDVCPTGALFRTEFSTVVVQQDICNGCGYCVSACPYGVIDRRPHDGRAQKCTLCYDRLHDGMEPACAQACPTQSIQFGKLDELRERADQRLAQLQDLGVTEARLYGRDPDDGVGGDGAFFLLLDEPEVYGLPPDPVVVTRDAKAMWKKVGQAAAAFALAGIGAFLSTAVGGRR